MKNEFAISMLDVEVLDDLLNEHRSKSFITCDETCFCWEVESLVSALQHGVQRTAFPVSFKMRVANFFISVGEWVANIRSR